jgi:DNA repair exonuclease SbcCD ATPase subunit
VKLKRLTINNFFAIGHSVLEFDDKGLVAIQGENLKDTSTVSNGAGKSSMADAIFWCNYGETARDGLSADEVVNWTAGKNCEVEAVWDDDGTTHVVTRWRKKSGPKKNGVSLVTTSPTGVSTDLTKGKDTLTQIEIDKALGCSKEVFTAAVYAAQKKLPNLPAMTDGELKQIIEKASDVEVLIAAYKIARDKLQDAERKQDSWRLEHVRAERDVTDAQGRVDQLTIQRDGYLGRQKQELAALGQALKDAVARARQKQTERDSIDAVRLQSEIDKFDQKIASVASERDEEDRLATIERDAITARTSLQAHFARASRDARDQKDRLDGVNGLVGQPCGECGKPHVEDDIAQAKALAETKLRNLIAVAREMQGDQAIVEKKVTEASQKLAEHRSNRTDVTHTVEERRRLAELLAVRRRAEEAQEIETASARRIKTQYETKQAEQNPFTDLVIGADRELSDAVTHHRKSEELGVACEKRVMVCKDVVKVFGPAGVRAHILDNVTPFLNDRTADYLGTMSDGNINAIWSTLSLNAKGETVEKFAIAVDKPGDAKSFAGLSGGEQRKVQLATALALQDLVASRASKPIEIWIGDEIDDALDSAGLERLMSILTKKARERGTVLVISHNSLNDWISDTVTVTRDASGFSKITGCLEAV